MTRMQTPFMPTGSERAWPCEPKPACDGIELREANGAQQTDKYKAINGFRRFPGQGRRAKSQESENVNGPLRLSFLWGPSILLCMACALGLPLTRHVLFGPKDIM